MTRQIFCIIALIVLTTPPARAGMIKESIYHACFDKYQVHAQERKCMENMALTSNDELKSAESAFLASLSKEDYDPQDIAAIKKAFITGSDAFQQYRQKYCDFYASLAAGGSGAGDLRLSCVVVLNNERVNDMERLEKAQK